MSERRLAGLVGICRRRKLSLFAELYRAGRWACPVACRSVVMKLMRAGLAEETEFLLYL